MSDTRYSKTSRLLHWGMAFLILLTIPAGLLMVQSGVDRGIQNVLFLYHKNVGMLLLILAVARLAYRLLCPAPKLPDRLPALHARIAHLSHGLLYALMIAVPFAGYVRVRAGGFPIESLDALALSSWVPRSDALAEAAKTFHYFSGLAIATLIILHVGAAFYHLLVQRDDIFQRIWPPLGGNKRP